MSEPMKKRSVFSPEDYKHPEKIHEEMLRAKADFERIINENNDLQSLREKEGI